MKTKPFTFTKGKKRLPIRIRCSQIRWELMNEKGKELGIEELKEILKRNGAETSSRTIMRWIRKGFFRSRKASRSRFINTKSFMSFIKEKEEEREREIEAKILRKEDRKRLARMRRSSTNDRLSLIGLG